MIPSIVIRLATVSDLQPIIQLDALSNPYPWGRTWLRRPYRLAKIG